MFRLQAHYKGGGGGGDGERGRVLNIQKPSLKK